MRVLIIGGGIIGLTIAREFQRNGETNVIVFDKSGPGCEASFAAAGMLAPQAESDVDDPFFHFCAAARDFYEGFTTEIESESGIEIELDRAGTIYAAFNEQDEAELEERYSWQTEAGYEVERLSARETHRLEPFISPDSIGSLYFPNDWQVENRILLKALVKSVTESGGVFRTSTMIGSVVSDGDSIIGVRSKDGTVYEGDLIILATGAWSSHIETDHTRLLVPAVRPIRGQMISYQTAKRLLTRVIYSARGYVVPRKDGRILAGATVEDIGFENIVTKEGVKELKQNAVEIVPSLVNLDPADEWSGLRPCTDDKLPLLGKIGEFRNLFVSTGHYRNGILLAPFSARILVDSILGKTASVYLDEFSPDRFKTAAARS